jgi:hypothetical protein
MLPQPLFGADLKVSKLLANGVQNRIKIYRREKLKNVHHGAHREDRGFFSKKTTGFRLAPE